MHNVIIQMIEEEEVEIRPQTAQQESQPELPKEEEDSPPMEVPYKLLKEHWLTIARPQYQRTCGISSLVSIWNHQFSRLGLGHRQPICIEQAMLKLNLIGKGSMEESMRKKQKKVKELTEKTDNSNTTEATQNNNSNPQKDPDINEKSLYEYVNSVEFGCFTGNDTLLRWYRLLCRIYGGVGRSYMFYKVNSDRSRHKTQETARKGLVEGLNNDNLSFIYHAYDHYFCPVGYEFVPKEESEGDTFQSDQVGEEGSELFVMVGESSKNFAPIHVFKWSQIELDLHTFWPELYNIRRRKEGVKMRQGKENDEPSTRTIDCIMAFEKLKD